MEYSFVPQSQPPVTDRQLADGTAFIHIDDANAPNACADIRLEYPTHDPDVRWSSRHLDGDVVASVCSHLRIKRADDLTRVKISDTLSLEIRETHGLPCRIAQKTSLSPPTETTASAPHLVTDGGTTALDRLERQQRVEELRAELAKRYDFSAGLTSVCAECGTHDDVDIDPGLSLADLQYRCEEHKRLRVKFWLFPGPHPSVPSGNNLFTCDECDDEFVFPYGVYAMGKWGTGGHESHEYRCLECATLEWLRQFCMEYNRMAGFEAMFTTDTGEDRGS